MDTRTDRLKIGIIGAGFSGTVLAATLDRLEHSPLDIYLCEKTGCFGTGEAYRTRLPFHLLNVKAEDMSAFEDDAAHFVNWLRAKHPHALQQAPYVPRLLYGDYLQSILEETKQTHAGQTKLQVIADEVVDVVTAGHQALLVFKHGQQQLVDKVIMATGNNPLATLPFKPCRSLNYIEDPWDPHLLNQIGRQDPVLIVGTGLTMIDIVLSLYHQHHQGNIYAVSRHGLLPLPHAPAASVPYSFNPQHIPHLIQPLTRFLRGKCKDFFQQHGDWRPVVSALRNHVPLIWKEINVLDKKKFIRHLLPYWNIHRHRVHHKTMEVLHTLVKKNQFHVLGGKMLGVDEGIAAVKLRHSQKMMTFEVKCIINCMGPSLKMDHQQPLIHSLLQKGLASLDALDLGFLTTAEGALIEKSGKKSSILYALGPPTKGTFWECSAVPEIRKNCLALVKNLLKIEEEVGNLC